MLSKLLKHKLSISLINFNLIEESEKLHPKYTDQHVRLPSITELLHQQVYDYEENEERDERAERERLSPVIRRVEAIVRTIGYPMVNYHQPRSRILPSQTLILNSVYKITEFPTRQMRHYLAKILGLPPRSVQIWFQNQRQKKRFGKK